MGCGGGKAPSGVRYGSELTTFHGGLDVEEVQADRGAAAEHVPASQAEEERVGDRTLGPRW